MNVQGMDVGQVQQTAEQLAEAAEQVGTWKTQLTSEVEGLDWEGDDATEFRSTWQGEVSEAFEDVQRKLEELAEELTWNAEEQRQASAQ